MSDRKKVLQIQNVSKSYGTFKALSDINFDIYEGEFFCTAWPVRWWKVQPSARAGGV